MAQYMLGFESDNSLGLLGIIMGLVFGLKFIKKVRILRLQGSVYEAKRRRPAPRSWAVSLVHKITSPPCGLACRVGCIAVRPQAS